MMRYRVRMTAMCGCVVMVAGAHAQEPAPQPSSQDLKTAVGDVEAARKQAAEKAATFKAAAEKAKKASEKTRTQAFDPETIRRAIEESPTTPKGQPIVTLEVGPPGKLAGQVTGAKTPPAQEMSALFVNLRRQVMRCWNIEAGAGKPPVVMLDFELDPTGRVVFGPRVVDASPSVDFEIAANNAIRAVKSCQPYALPQDKFEFWKSVRLSFDASNFAP